jgi:23S rRNA (guanosine2251-2'-O)-methyltransferase
MKDKRRPRASQGPDRSPKNGRYWLFGTHACEAALANPRRTIYKAAITTHARAEWQSALDKRHIALTVVEGHDLARELPPGAVHQGIALQVSSLPDADLEDFYDLPAQGTRILLALDQVTDPHNVGAILRSAAAFDVDALLLTTDNAATESGTLAKAASGALESMPVIRAVNLADALTRLKKHGWWIAGLDGEASQTMAEAKLSGNLALVLGAEGKGLRQLTRKHCDYLVRLPISEKMESLNVSNAAAVALYELRRS